jgi:hypothetical protein
MTSFFIATFQPTQFREKQILRPSMKTWWGLEEEMIRVTLCNSEKVLHMGITRAIQNSEENSDIQKLSRPLENPGL